MLLCFAIGSRFYAISRFALMKVKIAFEMNLKFQYTLLGVMIPKMKIFFYLALE